VKADLLERLMSARAAKRPVTLVTDLASGEQGLIFDDATDGTLVLKDNEIDSVRQAMRADRSGILAETGDRLFVHVFNPPERMIVVGAVHIAQVLAPMASLAGYDVTIVDPRRAFATDERFPDVTTLGDWPDEAMATLAPDSRTAVIALTHDPKIDDPALAAALASPAFYVGALGSTRTHANRLERLKARGFDADSLARIHGPIGLSIGAKTPAEIAIAIMAQVTAVRRGKPAGGAGARPAAGDRAA